MDIRTLQIPGPVVIVPKKFDDTRGFPSETYNEAAFDAGVARYDSQRLGLIDTQAH